MIAALSGNGIAPLVEVLLWIAVGLGAVWLATRVVYATVRAQQRRERHAEAAREAETQRPADDD